MFCIERKVVHVGAEKIITLYLYQVYVKFEEFSFTFNDAEDYARGELWQKVCTSFLKFSIEYKCQCGVLVESHVGDPEDISSNPPCVI